MDDAALQRMGKANRASRALEPLLERAFEEDGAVLVPTSLEWAAKDYRACTGGMDEEEQLVRKIRLRRPGLLGRVLPPTSAYVVYISPKHRRTIEKLNQMMAAGVVPDTGHGHVNESGAEVDHG